jgi:hypothetical protein
MSEFNIGDEVEFTDNCPQGWFFGPTTKYKTGIISSKYHSTSWDWNVLIGGYYGTVREEHIRLANRIIPYTELQNGDTDEDV